ncbi:MAG TPA: hypothetical protein VFI20_02355 [Terracidiphilus sp.]|nr:hypothetical protein [Terracidiphilus sp.]
MKTSLRPASALLTVPLILLTGCLFTTRKLPVPRAPSIVQTVSPADLVNCMNKRWDQMKTLNATVEIQASVLKTHEGVEKDYTSFRGHILIRKPGFLRVLGQVPMLGTRMFDMVSDGKKFMLYIPSKDKVVTGSNELHKKSPNRVENLRPGPFFDSMVVRGLEPGDLYSVTADSDTVEDASKKHLLVIPEYILSIMRQKSDSQELEPVRIVHFHRDDLLPYQQDLYDSNGNLETQVFYSKYENYGGIKYPSRVTIKRPMEDYQVVITVDKLVENMPLTDDQFVLNYPEGTKVQTLQ